MTGHAPGLPIEAIPYDYAAVVPDPDPTQRRLLLLPSPAGWGPPGWTIQDLTPPFWQAVDGVNLALHDQFGLSATTLRCLHTAFNEQHNRIVRIYDTDPQDAGWVIPADGRWFGLEDVDAVALAHPAYRRVLSAWFAETDTPEAPRARPPWAYRGWFVTAAAWIQTVLGSLNRNLTGPVEQLRAWERSSLLRAPTEAGWIYFKAVPAMFTHEPGVTRALAAWFPGVIPCVIAHDAERRWLLLEDFGGLTLDCVDDPDRWEAAIRGYARLQAACVDRVPSLLGLGCPARTLAEIGESVAAFVAEIAALHRGRPDGLTAPEIEQLRSLCPMIDSWLADIAAVGIPLTLEHGDFWPSNVAVARPGYVYFDWSDCAITHPFFSLSMFLDGAEDRFPHDVCVSTHLREAYLEPWTVHAPIEQLRPALDAAIRVAPLVRAMAYHRSILPHMSARWEMEAMVPYFVRRAIESMVGEQSSE